MTEIQLEKSYRVGDRVFATKAEAQDYLKTAKYYILAGLTPEDIDAIIERVSPLARERGKMIEEMARIVTRRRKAAGEMYRSPIGRKAEANGHQEEAAWLE